MRDDEFVPGWCEEMSELAALRAVNEQLRQQLAALRAELNPVSEHETLIGAVRNLKQALLSEQGNVQTLERQLAEARAALEQIMQ